MTWATATDDQLRRAAAERVMGWRVERECLYTWTEGGQPWSVGVNAWLYNWTRDDLARVFGAAQRIERLYSSPDMNRFVLGLWSIAIHDPRTALVGLLDLLFPDGPGQ